MHFCHYLHDEFLLPTETVETLETTVFAHFYGSQAPDTQAKTGSTEPTDDAAAVRSTLSLVCATATLEEYTRGNRRICERIAHDAVSWCNNQLAQMPGMPELDAEETQLSDASTSIERLCEAAVVARPELEPRVEFYLREADAHAADPDYVGLLTERLAGQWRERIDTERRTTRARRLSRSVGAFVGELQTVVPRLVAQQERMQDLFGSDDALFDNSVGTWTTDALEALAESAARLASAPELIGLAEVIGKSRVVTRDRHTFTEVRHERLEAVDVGKGEVTGIQAGDDLGSLLPAEAALLATPTTENLFFAKLATRQLLSLQFRAPRVVRRTTVRRVPVTVPEDVRRGPAIVCIDTSGSMLGEPERVAKALAPALAATLGRFSRDLYLIAFSTQIRTYRFAGPEDLSGLLSFVAGGFHGGTDLRPALQEALRMLDEQAFSLADVVVISDFRVPKIADRFQRLIQEQQNRGTVFHSVTVARGAVNDPNHIFDAHWLYDLSRDTPGIDPRSLARAW